MAAGPLAAQVTLARHPRFMKTLFLGSGAFEIHGQCRPMAGQQPKHESRILKNGSLSEKGGEAWN
jgi:hypothetical protein